MNGKKPKSKVVQTDFVLTVKAGQVYPPRFCWWIEYLKKNESVSYSRNVVSNSIRHSACVMNSEYVTRTSLYLDKLKIFEWMKFLRRHLHQIQGNWAGRKVLTASRVNSRLIMHARMQKWIWNTSTNGFNFRIINSLIESCGVRLTWLDCNSPEVHQVPDVLFGMI